MKFTYDDGGRADAGYEGDAGDCVCRSIAIAARLSYREVYGLINTAALRERGSKRRLSGKSSARTGVYKQTTRRLLAVLGWTWHPTMRVGSGCTVHLHDGELPMGRLVVQVSKHITAVIDGVIHDTWDPQREAHLIETDHGGALRPGQWRNENGICSVQRRCVYGYWSKP